MTSKILKRLSSGRMRRRPKEPTGGNPFSSHDDSSDIILVVEGKHLHVSKLVLSLASPVFKTLFNGEFKDKPVLHLHSQKYDDFVELLLCIYPSTNKKVTVDTMDAILPVANEYGIASVKKRCEELIHSEVERESSGANAVVHMLYLTDKYKLPQGLRTCVDNMKSSMYSGRTGFKNHKDFQGSSMHTQLSLLSERLACLETAVEDIFKSDAMATVLRLKDSLANAQCVGCKKGQADKHTSCICQALIGSDVKDFVQKIVKLCQVMK